MISEEFKIEDLD